jgi:phage tail-like protein
MSQLSSYVDYLPPVLWSAESDKTSFLARWLCAFEKILTGIDDDITFAYAPLERTIDRIPQLFDPWRTEVRFLPMLATWVGLVVPEAWAQDEYRLRQLVAKIVGIYEQHGLKRGLHTYLDIYAATAARPRIAIDDGEALFRLTILADGTARLDVVAHTHRGPTSGKQPDVALLHPAALATTTDGDVIVADAGGKDAGLEDIPASLWRVSSTGELPFELRGANLPALKPIHRGTPLKIPVAVVVDWLGGFGVLDVGETTDDKPRAAIHRFTAAGFDKTIIEKDAFKVVHPVDMIVDGQRRFVVLDRGLHPAGFPPAGPAKTRLVIVDKAFTATPSIVVHELPEVVEPAALTIDATGRYVIADAGDQKKTAPANLRRINPTGNWQGTWLLNEAHNPLVFPTGLVFLDPATLVVCDTGLRWGASDDRSNRVLAEPAAVFRIDLSGDPPAITPLTRTSRLVNPSKIARAGADTLIVADRGECYRRETSLGTWQEWRARPHQFGVVVHFSQQRPTTPGERNNMRREIWAVVDEHRPGHAAFWMEI